MLPIILSLAVLAAPADTKNTASGKRSVSGLGAPLAGGLNASPSQAEALQKNYINLLAASIAKRIPARMGAKRGPYARTLAQAIVREARRRGLDPVALAVVGWIESDWQSWRTRAGDGSHGVWQLMRHGATSREARALLSGCRSQGLCEAPEIARLRRSQGAWTIAELRDPNISTYIAAYSIRRHVLSCHARRHGPHRHPACRGLGWLTRYSHYNSGWNPPRWYYLQRLCRRYRILRAEIGRH